MRTSTRGLWKALLVGALCLGGISLVFLLGFRRDALAQVAGAVSAGVAVGLAVLLAACAVILLAVRSIRMADLKDSRNRAFRSRDRYLGLFEHNPAVMFLVDPESGLIVEANASARAFYGLQSLPGNHISRINPLPEDRLNEAMKRTVDRGGQRHEFVHTLGSGEHREVEVFSGPITQNERTLLFSIVFDVTEQRGTERALRQAERQARELFEEAPVGIYRTSMQSGYLDANQALADMYGYASPEDLLTTVRDIGGQVFENRSDWERLRAELAEKGVVEGFECRVPRPDGKLVWTSRDARAKRDERGRILYYEGFVRDITAERELARLREDVENITRHDLKSPLSGIMGLAEHMAEETGDPEIAEAFRQVRDSARKVLRLVNRSLVLFRMEQGTYEPTAERVRLDEAARRTAAENLLLLERKGLDLDTDGLRSVEARAEEELVGTALGNLLRNAAEAAPPGGRIRLATRSEGRWADLYLTNPGLPPAEMRGRFFEKYATRGKHRGTGLGAYSARLMTRVMGGELSVILDEAAQATTLHLRLPGWREE
ncbi:sensor histidine kinase [Desulfohalovibrio reitneri]|uniref:sensor histidine kinase n=1 Tax=Desulfohalovibrio reitneri TaxID=1307759 RepID=UPI0004A6BD74|nr:PAS domain-containing sensor histidine kinase [Desulfohalovibrio reitneri]